MIPKKVHVTWKTKYIKNKDSVFYQSCLGSIERLSPDWTIEISDDKDVEDYLFKYLNREDYDLLFSRSIIEKIDVWRLLKMYYEGGLYVDMDRLCNVSLNDIIDENTKLVLPTCADHDFSHDFMMSEPGNPIFSETLNLNLLRRRAGANSVYLLGPQTYMHGIMKAMFGDPIDIPSGSPVFERIRSFIKEIDFIITYREVPPLHSIIYRPELKQIDFDYEEEKRKFYKHNGIRHWTNEW